MYFCFAKSNIVYMPNIFDEVLKIILLKISQKRKKKRMKYASKKTIEIVGGVLRVLLLPSYFI